jgi:hypothetical protein
MTSTIIQNSNQVSKVTAISTRRKAKKTQAKELYTKYHTLPREAIIQKFIEELEMPENSASTYVSLCAKELNVHLGLEFKTRKAKRTSSKRERAFAIFANNAEKGRKAIIEIMKRELEMSHNSAATHCSLAYQAYMAGKITAAKSE